MESTEEPMSTQGSGATNWTKANALAPDWQRPSSTTSVCYSDAYSEWVHEVGNFMFGRRSGENADDFHGGGAGPRLGGLRRRGKGRQSADDHNSRAATRPRGERACRD